MLTDMLDKKELRIGNYVVAKANVAQFLTVKAVMNDGVYVSEGVFASFQDLEPVAITETVLLRFAFVYGRKFFDDDFYDIKEVKTLSGNDCWAFRQNNQTLTYIQFLHQAQNLLYDICQHEL